MFERFDDSARNAIVLAQSAARDLGHHQVGTEHLLLGVLSDIQEPPARVRKTFNFDRDRAYTQVAQTFGVSNDRHQGGIPFTPRAKKALELSLREMLDLEHDSIGTGHVLLGIVDIDDGGAKRVLLNSGVQPEELRSPLLKLLGGPKKHRDALPNFNPVVTMRDEGPYGALPDAQLEKLLRTAGLRARTDGRDEFTVAELLLLLKESSGP